MCKLFKQHLKLDDIRIEDAFRIGSGDTRPILVKLFDYKQKRDIFMNSNKLKTVKNSDGRPIYINNHLPEQVNEEKHRHRQIIKENAKLVGSKTDVEIRGNMLYIDNEPYRKQAPPPKAKQVLKAEAEERKLARSTKMFKCSSIARENSKFTGYAMNIHSLDDARLGYMKLKMQFGDATHISMANRLAGIDYANMQDFSDDREHGAGRNLLQILAEQGAMNKAIFVIREYDGVNLGQLRFALLKQVAAAALKKVPSVPQRNPSGSSSYRRLITANRLCHPSHSEVHVVVVALIYQPPNELLRKCLTHIVMLIPVWMNLHRVRKKARMKTTIVRLWTLK